MQSFTDFIPILKTYTYENIPIPTTEINSIMKNANLKLNSNTLLMVISRVV